ncbi:MAG: glycosyltransferase family 39 protein [Thermoanaerobaculia bacterium]
MVEVLSALFALHAREVLPALSIAAAGVVAWRLPPAGIRSLDRWLCSRNAPLFFGAASAFVYAWIWASLSGIPVIHDEAAYVLQARIFASGRWSAPARPLSEFFEQFHVFVTPVLASKYPPGHSLLLIPGVWLGLPGLVPLLLTGLTGGLLFALARRLSNPWAALLAWLLWTTNRGDLRFRPGYFSEVTTTALWLLGWWFLCEWWRTGKRRWLLMLAACVAWGGLTRPLSMLAFALPAGGLALRRAWTLRAVRDVALAACLACAILGVIPIWNAKTTGHWQVDALSLYSRTHLPFNRPGFGLDPSAPQVPMNPERRQFAQDFRPVHAAHTVAALPRILGDRLLAIGTDAWGGFRVLLVPLFVVGLLVLPAEAILAIATCALLVVFHLVLAQKPQWTLYYLEVQPVLAFATAAGVWKAITLLSTRQAVKSGEPPREVARAGRPELVVLVLSVACLGFWWNAIGQARLQKEQACAYQFAFRSLVDRIPEPRSIVFVKYGADHPNALSLVANEPDLARARIWLALDHGQDNTRLARLAPERATYLYDETSRRLVRLSGGGRSS